MCVKTRSHHLSKKHSESHVVLSIRGESWGHSRQVLTWQLPLYVNFPMSWLTTVIFTINVHKLTQAYSTNTQTSPQTSASQRTALHYITRLCTILHTTLFSTCPLLLLLLYKLCFACTVSAEKPTELLLQKNNGRESTTNLFTPFSRPRLR